jgi:DNA-directed RNA polymerase subunit beta'
MPFINGLLKKKGIGAAGELLLPALRARDHGQDARRVKTSASSMRRKAGLSIGIDDMVIPDSKKTLVKDAEKQVIAVQQQYLDGAITNGERYNKVIEIWSAITEKVADEMFGRCSARQGRRSIRFTSWPTPALADRNSRFASSPACAD